MFVLQVHPGEMVGALAAQSLGRTCHTDDTEHFPLRWCVGQERHSGSAATQGDHQHLKEAEDTLTDCTLGWTGC